MRRVDWSNGRSESVVAYERLRVAFPLPAESGPSFGTEVIGELDDTPSRSSSAVRVSFSLPSTTSQPIPSPTPSSTLRAPCFPLKSLAIRICLNTTHTWAVSRSTAHHSDDLPYAGDTAPSRLVLQKRPMSSRTRAQRLDGAADV